MNTALEKLQRAAAGLPRDQQLALARFLLELEPTIPVVEAEAAWDAEIRQRVRAVELGHTQALPYDQVLARIDKHLPQ